MRYAAAKRKTTLTNTQAHWRPSHVTNTNTASNLSDKMQWRSFTYDIGLVFSLAFISCCLALLFIYQVFQKHPVWALLGLVIDNYVSYMMAPLYVLSGERWPFEINSMWKEVILSEKLITLVRLCGVEVFLCISKGQVTLWRLLWKCTRTTCDT